MEVDSRKNLRWRQQLVAAVVIAVLVVAGWWVWPRIPLRGERNHDFGVVRFELSPKYVEHTFSLENTSSSPIQVSRSKSSCGCTEAVVPGEVIAPGNFLEVPIRLKLTHTGLKDAMVTLYFHDGGSIDLGVEAIGKAMQSFRASPSKLRLRPPKGLGNAKLWMESDTEPPVPSIDGPPRMTIDFGGWLQTGLRDEQTSTPPSWTAKVSMISSGAGPPSGSVITFALPNGHEAVVTVNPRLFFPPPTTADPMRMTAPVGP
jgi:hypothetical protein